MSLVNVTAVSVEDFDSMTLLLWSVMVFFMQAGFALYEAGSVEPRLATNVLFKNMVDSSVVALAFWLLGYGLAFGEPSSAFAGLGEFCLIGTAPAALAYVFFQYSFSATTATIISGGTAGRMRVLGYLIFTLFVGALLHPLVAHWIWAPSGFLKFGGRNAVFGVGMIDFAGGVAVHVNAGAATLAAILVLGYRNQMSGDPKNPPRFEKVADGKWKVNDLPVSSRGKIALGTFILWFGFFAFNISSFVNFAGRTDLAALVALNTALCSGAAALGCIVLAQLLRRAPSAPLHWSIEDACNGTLAGLVAATSCCSVVQPWAAVLAGVLAALVYQSLARLMLFFRLDDPVQAVAVHFGCGFLSVLMAALFADRSLVVRVFPEYPNPPFGLFLGGGGLPLAGMAVGVLVVSAFTMLVTALFLGLLRLVDRRLGFRWFFMRSTVHSEREDRAAEDVIEPFFSGIADVVRAASSSSSSSRSSSSSSSSAGADAAYSLASFAVVSPRGAPELPELLEAQRPAPGASKQQRKAAKKLLRQQQQQQHLEQRRQRKERKRALKLQQRQEEQQQQQQQQQMRLDLDDVELGLVQNYSASKTDL